MVKPILNDAEQTRIKHAVMTVERQSSGEIMTVIAPQSDDYYPACLIFGICVAFAVALLASLSHPFRPFLFYWLLQLAVFLAVTIGLHHFAQGWRLTPKPHRRKLIRQAAEQQFFLQNLASTENRAGILIYISLHEHAVELVADTGIAGKVPVDAWQKITDDLSSTIKMGHMAQGICEAVMACGTLLASHFPAETPEINNLSDDVIQLS